jgi:plasmid stability protein
MANKTGSGSGSIIVRKVPDDLRRRFKARCASDGISQQDKIIELMAAYVAADNRPA